MNKKKMVISPMIMQKVKGIIKDAKSKKIIKPHKEAFDNNPIDLEYHKGKVSYFK